MFLDHLLKQTKVLHFAQRSHKTQNTSEYRRSSYIKIHESNVDELLKFLSPLIKIRYFSPHHLLLPL